jgi:hypothetical protein
MIADDGAVAVPGATGLRGRAWHSHLALHAWMTDSASHDPFAGRGAVLPCSPLDRRRSAAAVRIGSQRRGLIELRRQGPPANTGWRASRSSPAGSSTRYCGVIDEAPGSGRVRTASEHRVGARSSPTAVVGETRRGTAWRASGARGTRSLSSSSTGGGTRRARTRCSARSRTPHSSSGRSTWWSPPEQKQPSRPAREKRGAGGVFFAHWAWFVVVVHPRPGAAHARLRGSGL